MLAIKAALSVGLSGCGYCVWVRMRDVARDLYYGTGSVEWYRHSAVAVLAWSFTGYLCAALLLRR